MMYFFIMYFSRMPVMCIIAGDDVEVLMSRSFCARIGTILESTLRLKENHDSRNVPSRVNPWNVDIWECPNNCTKNYNLSREISILQ